ncbi:unnamed protein product, partial [Ostreobium quekettii]
ASFRLTDFEGVDDCPTHSCGHNLCGFRHISTAHERRQDPVARRDNSSGTRASKAFNFMGGTSTRGPCALSC